MSKAEDDVEHLIKKGRI